MNIFCRRKSKREKTSPSSDVPDSEPSFYARGTGSGSLNEFSRSTHRTSLHSPARRRETSHRVSDKAIAHLLFRAGVIVFLLVGGFLALKMILGRIADQPSEKEKRQWAINAALMEKEESADRVDKESVSTALSDHSFSTQLIEKRLRVWKKAAQSMRSAEALDQRGIDEQATLRLEQALRAVPDHRAAQYLLMKIHMRSGRYAQGIPLCIRLLDQDPQQWDVKLDLLEALRILGQTGAGLVLAEQMLEKEPNNTYLLEVAACAQRTSGNDEEALTLFDRLLQNDPQHFVALVSSGSIYQEREEWKKATPYYLRLVRIQMGVEHYRDLVLCYARQAEAGKAVIFMGQASTLYGETEVSSWLRNDLEAFDLIRETVEYRSFVDRLMGIEERQAVDAIRRREIQKKTDGAPGGFDLPAKPDLKINPVL